MLDNFQGRLINLQGLKRSFLINYLPYANSHCFLFRTFPHHETYTPYYGHDNFKVLKLNTRLELISSNN